MRSVSEFYLSKTWDNALPQASSEKGSSTCEFCEFNWRIRDLWLVFPHPQNHGNIHMPNSFSNFEMNKGYKMLTTQKGQTGSIKHGSVTCQIHPSYSLYRPLPIIQWSDCEMVFFGQKNNLSSYSSSLLRLSAWLVNFVHLTWPDLLE